MPADFCHVCIIPATYSLGQKLFSLPESNVTSFDIGSPQQAVSSISVASEKLRKQWPIPNHHTVLLAILASLLLALGFVLAAPWLHLRNIPGPLWAAYTRFWLVKVLASGESAAKFVDVNKTYGKTSVFFVLIFFILEKTAILAFAYVLNMRHRATGSDWAKPSSNR